VADGVIVDEGARQAELSDSALELTSRLLRILQRQRRQPCEPARAPRNDLGQEVIGSTAICRSGGICTPGEVRDSTCMSIPYLSISGSRYSVKSSSRCFQRSAGSGFIQVILAVGALRARPAGQKASSKATRRMKTISD
jgi:hypothetical protein